MATQVQFRRGTGAQSNNFTGGAGEITVNLSNMALRVHDGSTVGGFEMARADLTNVTGNIPATATGSNAAVQYNDLGVLGGSSFYTYDNVNQVVSMPNIALAGTVNTDFIPKGNAQYSLGNSTNYWKDLYLSGSTIYLGEANIKSIQDIVLIQGLTIRADGSAPPVTPAAGTLSVEGAANIAGNLSAPNATFNTTLVANVATMTTQTVTGNLVANVAAVTDLTATSATLGNISVTNLTVTGNSQVGAIINGTSNVSVSSVNGPVTMGVNGTANVVVVDENGMTVTGTTTANGNLVVQGDLVVNGNTNYVNVTSLSIADPILDVGGASNNAPLTHPDFKDRGSALYTYGAGLTATTNGTTPVGNTYIELLDTTGIQVGMKIAISNTPGVIPDNTIITAVNASNIRIDTATLVQIADTTNLQIGKDKINFMGWDSSNAEFSFGKDVGIINDLVSFSNGFGNVRTGVIKATGANLTGTLTSNANVDFSGPSVSLGDIANLHIDGGLADQALMTDGSGGLSWATLSSSKIFNGTSNVEIAAAGGNITFTSAGVTSMNVTDTVVEVTGNANVSDTLNAANANITDLVVSNTANLGNVANVFITGGTNAQFLQTDGSGNLTWATVNSDKISNGTSNVSVREDANVNISANGQANIVIVSSNGTHALTTVNNDLTVTGNLNVSGDEIVTSTVSQTLVEPITDLGTAANFAPLTSNDGKDRGVAMHTFGVGRTITVTSAVPAGNTTIKLASTAGITAGMTIGHPSSNATIPNGTKVVTVNAGNIVIDTPTTALIANTSSLSVGTDDIRFMGWDVSNSEFVFSDTTSITGSIISPDNLGNVRAGYFIGNVSGDTLELTGDANVAGSVIAANVETEKVYKGTSSIDIVNNGDISITNAGNTIASIEATGVIVTGNVTADNFFGANLTNGNSGVFVIANGNVGITATGSANVLSVSKDGVVVAGDFTAQNIIQGSSNIAIAVDGDITISSNGHDKIVTVNSNGTHALTTFKDDVTITGNLNISGTQVTTNTQSVTVVNPIQDLGTNTYDAPLTTATTKDRGIALHTYGEGFTVTTSGSTPSGNTRIELNSVVGITAGMPIGDSTNGFIPAGTTVLSVAASHIVISDATTDVIDDATTLEVGHDNLVFMGWQIANSEIVMGSNTSIVGGVTTVNTLANVRADTVIANIDSATGIFSSDVNVAGVINAADMNNGNSNIHIDANGAVKFSSGGNANILMVTDVGANVEGTLDVTGTLSLPDVANLYLPGGTGGQALFTDGQGNLVFANIDHNQLSNGTSNISIVQDGNISFSSAGIANLMVVTDTDVVISAANVSGTMYVAGESNIVGNVVMSGDSVDLGAVGKLHISGGSDGQVLKTDGSGNLSWLTVSTTSIMNGNSSIDVATNADITFTSNGVADIATFSATKAVPNVYVVSADAAIGATILSVADATLVKAGQPVSGAGIDTNTTIASIVGTTITLDKPTIAAITTNDTITIGVEHSSVSFADAVDMPGKVTFGDAALVSIQGGSDKQFLQTDGNGNLTWATVDSFQIANGNSNVYVNANGDVTISSAGNANVIVVSDLGANVTGTLNVDGNATANYFLSNYFYNGNSGVAVDANANVSITVTGTANVLLATVDGITVANLTTTDEANVDSLTVVGKSNLNAIGNVTITGGSNLQVVQTDGAGNLSFVDVTTVWNGTSNIFVDANADVVISSNGHANIITVTSDGANALTTFQDDVTITGNLTVQGAVTSVSTSSAELVNPIIDLGTGANFSPLITDDGQDRGIALHTMGSGFSVISSGVTPSGNTFIELGDVTGITVGMSIGFTGSNIAIPQGTTVVAVNASNVEISAATGAPIASSSVLSVGTDEIRFMGWHVANAEFMVTKTSTISGGVVDVTALGNLRADSFLGNVDGESGTFSANVEANVVIANSVQTGNINNGNTVVAIAANGNISIDVAGTANVLVLSDVTAKLEGNLKVANGNISTDSKITAENITANSTVKAANIDSGLIFQGNSNVAIATDGNITFGVNTVADVLTITDGAIIVANANISRMFNGSSNVEIATDANITFGVTGNANVLTVTDTGIIAANITTEKLIQGNANIAFNTDAAANGNLTFSVGGYANIFDITATETGTHAISNISGDVNISGNLNIAGSQVATNVDTVTVVNPIMDLGTGTNGAPLSTPSLMDRGLLLHTTGTGFDIIAAGDTLTGSTTIELVDTTGITVGMNIGMASNDAIPAGATVTAVNPTNIVISASTTKDILDGNELQVGDDVLRFMGWDVSNTEFVLAKTSSVSNFVVASSALGNLRIDTLLGNVDGDTLALTGDATIEGNVNVPTVQNGNTSIALAANGNVSFSMTGTANVVVFTDTGANIDGTANVTGNVAFGANLTVTDDIKANAFVQGALVWGNSSVGISAADGQIDLTANSNVTFSATETGANVTGTLGVTGDVTFDSNVTFADVANVIIPGGSSGQLLSTDGSGALSWTDGGSSSWKTKMISIAFDADATIPLFTLPANAIVDRISVFTDVVFDGTSTLTIGKNGGSASAYVTLTDDLLTVAGRLDVHSDLPPETSTVDIEGYYVSGGATVGSARILITYCIPD